MTTRSQAFAKRAALAWLLGHGWSVRTAAAALGVHWTVAYRWRRRYDWPKAVAAARQVEDALRDASELGWR